MLDDLLGKWLRPVLDRMGSGWKTAAGLLALALVQALSALGWIDDDTRSTLGELALVLFGIGVWHEKVKQRSGLMRAVPAHRVKGERSHRWASEANTSCTTGRGSWSRP